MQVSACVICKNESKRIGLALDSVAWCHEIVVVDSGSTDGTLEICRAHPSGKVRVVSHGWEGFALQRKFAAEQCGLPWVLMLDADEECSPALQKEIGALAEAADVGLFEIPRHNYIARRYIPSWGPDWQSRLVHRDRVEWHPQSIPEIRQPKAGFVTRRISSPLLHNRLTPYQPTDFNDGRKMEQYAELLAESMYARGRRATFMNLVFRPWATFVKFYFLKGAFLQGRFGLVASYKAAIGVTLKYSALYGRELAEQKRSEDETAA